MPNTPAALKLSGFGSHFSSEAVVGALPIGQNSPQKVPFGLYAEQFSGTSFTAPRLQNRRSWMYRLRPTAMHPAFEPYTRGTGLFKSAPFHDVPPTPNRLRWDPLPYPQTSTDFIDGLVTLGGNGDVNAGWGVGIHLFAATASMKNRAFFSADGEILIVPQEGRLHIVTELGRFTLAPLHVAVIPRGLRFRVELLDPKARGYIAENYGHYLRLPELGPIGANGLANPRDFETPSAAFEDVNEPYELVQKFQGNLWTTELKWSPFDVVAWHGNLVPYTYDLSRFNVINTVSFDHSDPSIFTVLTSPSDSAAAANFDFVIFPPRWAVAEHTFRPPWFHRNVASEFMGLLEGKYDAKEGGFVPGGGSLHNCMNSHGPDRASYERAVEAKLEPVKITGTMAFMFETRAVIIPTKWAMHTPTRQKDYDSAWSGFTSATTAQPHKN